jgi:hypothetical protein
MWVTISRRTGTTLLSAFAIAALTGCNSLGLGGEPEELSLQVEATGATQVHLVTSTQWVYQQDPACEAGEGQTCPEVIRVFAADTSTVAVPLNRTLRFTSDNKYLVEVYPTGGASATLRMRIEIDGKEWYNDQRQLTPVNGVPQTLQFVYQWREPTLR